MDFYPEIHFCYFIHSNKSETHYQGGDHMTTIQEFRQRKPITQILIPNAELVAALFSGILILIAWLIENETTSIFFYILAFVIGGFAKAKEGIEATIRDKELNVEMLMILAAIGSSIIGYWTEGAILIFIFAVSGALETYTMNKSNKEISSLMELQPEEAWKINSDGTTTRVAISEIKLGDHLIVKPGERVPADGIVLSGATSIDEAAISGESIPVSKQVNDELFAGTVNISGAITLEMTKANEDSLFQKLNRQISKINEDLSFEFSAELVEGKREFIISADGILSAFQDVINLVEQAPPLDGFKIIAFRQKGDIQDLPSIEFEDITLAPDHVFFTYRKNGDTLDIVLYIQGYDADSDDWIPASFILLDLIVGEYDVATKLGSIDFLPYAEGPNLKSIVEVPAVVDREINWISK